MQDQLHRFIFQDKSIRGELVNVSNTWRKIVEAHDYPTPVKTLLGEMLAATTLLTATLKLDGDITLQLQGDGPLRLAVIHGNNHQETRGIARLKGEIKDGASLKEMLGEGQLVITLTPKQGKQYQGLVSLEKETLAGCLEDYFMHSEQILTHLILLTNSDGDTLSAGGLLLQILPSEKDITNDFRELCILTDTIRLEEITDLPANEALWRIYHQEKVMILDPQPVCFKCICSRERCENILKMLSPEELNSTLQTEGKVDIYCEYCNTHYLFNADDIHQMNKGSSESAPS